MEQYQEVCRITLSVPNYTCIYLDFVRGFGSYVKGLPKTKRCYLVAVTASVRCTCEMALRQRFACPEETLKNLTRLNLTFMHQVVKMGAYCFLSCGCLQQNYMSLDKLNVIQIIYYFLPNSGF